MKLAITVLLVTIAAVWADTSYQNFQTYQNTHDLATDLATDASNYYETQTESQQPNRRVGAGGLTGLLQQQLNPIRRQGFSGIVSFIIGPLGLLAVFIILAFIAYGYYAALFNSSGRGLDTDEWEVDHSVWMNQLQKDFEDSWSHE